MKIGEIKMRLVNSIMDLIDTYFGENIMSEKFVNSTLKLILKQQINKVDSLLALFADENGEINMDDVILEYAQIIDEEGYVFDLKKFIENETIKSFIPDKVLIIKRDDIFNILR